MSKKFKKYRPNIIYWNFNNVTFDMCGLDIEKNFLHAPLCECGCGGYCDICAYDDEIADVCANLADVNDCDYCGVFAITSKNECIFALKMYDDEEDDIMTTVFRKELDDGYKSIGEIADKLQLHCYGLLVCKGNGTYKIVME